MSEIAENPGEEEQVDVDDNDSVQFTKKQVTLYICAKDVKVYANNLGHSIVGPILCSTRVLAHSW